MAGEFPGDDGVNIVITGDFFIRQLPISGNFNFPPEFP